MSNLIDLIPVELLDDIRLGECLPIVGAGFSRNALLPPRCQMPLWNDLGAQVAKRMGRVDSSSPTTELSEYCREFSKFELIKLLRRSLHICTARPGAVHTQFATLPFQQVLTTNFDFLIERAYDEAGKSYLPVVDEDLLSFGRPDGEVRIIKMHGDLHHPSLMVVTEEDYDNFRDGHTPMFNEVTNLLTKHSVLFIGYSIDDPDFRQIWRLVDRYLGALRRPAYAILVGATNGQVETYRRRGVTKVLTLPGSPKNYGAILAEALQVIGGAVKARAGRRL